MLMYTKMDLVTFRFFKTGLSIVLCITSIVILAQDIPFDKKMFPNDKDGFKDARDNIKEGDRFFEEGEPFYNLAIPYYEKANDFNPNNAALNFKLGLCYLESPNKRKCLKYFKKSYELNPELDPLNINFLIARGYHLNEEWDKALEYYSSQLNEMAGYDVTEEQYRNIRKHHQEALNGKELVQNPVRVWIDNLGPTVNSEWPEFAPLISTDERIMILTARRPNSTGELIFELDGLPYEDLYYTQNVEGDWTPLANMGDKVNTSGHDATSGLAPDGKVLFVFRGTVKGGGDVYVARDEEDGWSKPKALGKYINTDYHESAVALSYDQNDLYFISDKPGGIGGRDIYVSRWNDDKEEWGEAENLGPVVNSPYNEDGVFIHPDGKTIYFSSKGHNSMGGSDIFYTEQVNGQWTKPVNIGYPINTPDDDVFFVVAADGRTAYYSSIRDEGYGEKDIYRITFLGPEKQPVLNMEEKLFTDSEEKILELPVQPPVKIKTSKMVLLKGLVLDEETDEPVVANIDLIDNKTSEVLATFKSDAEDGSYLVSLPVGRNYGLNFNADEYLFNSLNFDLPDSADFKEVYKIIRLKKIKIGKSIILRNIFFDFDKFTIRSESEAELTRLYELLQENPDIKVEISGHTDNRGDDDYNQKLSENRAKAVVDWLINKGIPQSRMIYAGYGEKEPVATNETDEGRQENRRTEFKIIEN